MEAITDAVPNEPDEAAGVDDETDTEPDADAFGDDNAETAAEVAHEREPEADISQIIAAAVTPASDVVDAAEEPAEVPGAVDDEPLPEPEPEPETELAVEAEPEEEPEAEPETEPEDEPESAETEPEGAPAAPPPRALDEDLRSILQEEAEREMQARAADRSHEPQAMETQPDLGLDAGPSAEDERRRIARERMAGLQGDDDGPEIEATLAAGSAAVAGAAGLAAAASAGDQRQPRRDLFPDIEEINSTLDGYGPDERMAAEDNDARSRAGFGRAFLMVLVIVVLAIALYILAPKLAETVPALEPILSAYVGLVNQGRAWLDTTLQGLTGKTGSP